eukprot:TRINITY_DN1534_c1_g1_i1.p1 TRINITY_DN1534_c1_g1~~TRINITY_DN1534_c1_g1_i1.p1  ORF type:complete len:108 (+),score=0.71 TRINITY_DN1534_c1_g1_i1:285-608(+)
MAAKNVFFSSFSFPVFVHTGTEMLLYFCCGYHFVMSVFLSYFRILAAEQIVFVLAFDIGFLISSSSFVFMLILWPQRGWRPCSGFFLFRLSSPMYLVFFFWSGSERF